MDLSILNKHVPARLTAQARRLAATRGQAMGAVAGGLAVGFGVAGHAFAQAVAGASPAGGLGAQMNLISGETINAGGTAFGMGCYIAAAICFFFGVWAIWQSRQPQHRETGYIGRGVAGLLLCGLFATAGVWINKAAISASGGAATITGANAQAVTFGTGGGAGG